jgi:hypothetical protein
VTVLSPSFLHYGRAPGEYLASVLRSIGYNARYGGQVDATKIFAGAGNVSFNGWFADFVAPFGFFASIDDCGAYKATSLGPKAGALCTPMIAREFVKAHALQTTDPEQATLVWRKLDRDVTDLAPWVPYVNPGALYLLSQRTGNFQFNPQWGTLLDQLWVR